MTGQAVTGKEKICVDDKPLRVSDRRPTYLMLYKPRGYVTTLADDLGRKCVKNLITGVNARVFPVGRLDKDSEGMLLLTDDGALANRLMSPASHVPKTYRVTVDGKVSETMLAQMTQGMTLDDGLELLPAQVTVKSNENDRAVLQITLYEGKNRQIRRMCEQLGLNVKLLKRERIGELRLGDIKPGGLRFLSEEEIAYLKSI